MWRRNQGLSRSASPLTRRHSRYVNTHSHTHTHTHTYIHKQTRTHTHIHICDCILWVHAHLESLHDYTSRIYIYILTRKLSVPREKLLAIQRVSNLYIQTQQMSTPVFSNGWKSKSNSLRANRTNQTKECVRGRNPAQAPWAVFIDEYILGCYLLIGDATLEYLECVVFLVFFS